MYAIEIVRFTVKKGAEQAMLAERPAMVRAIRLRHPIYMDAYLARLDDGSWVDLVIWADRAQAESITEDIHLDSDIAKWFRHIDQILGSDYADIHDINRLNIKPYGLGASNAIR
ncbi:hypothetical protein [Nonomuraea dietziae]|uniref:ABM domain-containing protein n=1 Tax=Nonomuraea dietziae TaxID=65515 RepID=A0A7W5VT32_9ACTN|nr:hypothetical protein [Nonomuraea dietziae]MBB3734012.1 hypothetical protein [Nonomuraea dietziae]